MVMLHLNYWQSCQLAGGTWTESSTGTLVEVTSIGTRASVKICKGSCSTVSPIASPSTIPSVSPTNIPSAPPITEAPSNAPSDIPSAISSEAPSIVPSDTPSIVPSDAPAVDRCDIMDVFSQTIYVPGAGSCWRIQLGRGGTLEGDMNGNESCQKSESDWQSSTSTFSNFSAVLPNDDIAVFEAKATGQWKGTFLFKEDPAATKPYLVPPLDIDSANKTFNLVVSIPTCSADAICPTMKVNLF